MTIVLIIRHGETDYVAQHRAAGRKPGISLNAEGRRQAAALAQRLKHLPITAIYASPMQRTLETADALSSALNLSVHVCPRLLETDIGEWTDLYFKDIEERYADIWSALQRHPKGTRIPGGETIDEIQERMAAEITDIARDHPHDIVAVVSHADPIKAAISYFIGLDLDCFQRLVIGPTSVTVLALDEHGARLVTMNHMGELPDLTPVQAQKPTIRRMTLPQEGQDMPRTIYDMKSPSRVTASAVGLPGERAFYVQARDDERLLTLLCEKEQVAALALGIEELIEEMDEKQPDAGPAVPIPAADLELEQPLEPVFRIGQLGLGFDPEANAVVLVAYERPEKEDADPDTLAVARIWATRNQARALSRHAAAVVAGGRPLCPLCGEPMDLSGHICPKKNGHKKIDASE